jgi:hypothetical protein
MTRFALAVLLAAMSWGCDDAFPDFAKAEKAQWDGPCADEAVLLATTADSPSKFRCWNKHHRMRVDDVTKSTTEHPAALIFCECMHDDDAGPHQP